MPFTQEQETIFEAVKDKNIEFLKVNSVAGSGKTTVLVEISKILNPKNGIYLAYNKAIATEAGAKFSSGMTCMTTHSLAYQNTVGSFGLQVGFFNYKSIKEKMYYEHKVILIDTLRDFCLSRHAKFDDFVNQKRREIANIPDKVYDLARKYFSRMAKGEVPITHDAYLKLYHILLHNHKIEHKPFDVVMLDEAGDLNEVTLEIFKLLPTKKKIMVGDENQNIYTFNNTINGFTMMKDIGTELHMTRSFRCSIVIANRIEGFCKSFIDPSMEFKGTDSSDMEIRTQAYITRNNSSLVGKMIELQARGTKYNLTRPVKSIFELILILLNLKPGEKIYSPEWKHLQEDIDNWKYSGQLQFEFKTPLSYITSLYGADPGISSALNVIREYGPGPIFAANRNAKAHEKEKGHAYTLCTAHSSKGLEFDRVIIAQDLNDITGKVIAEKSRIDYEPKDIETMRLYYVACSRALKDIVNAKHLPEG